MRLPQLSLAIVLAFIALLVLHLPYIGLPYFWDEAGYYIPAAWDIYGKWEFVPTSTLPTGHTPLVMIYLALAWHTFGYSPTVTRLAMILIASATVAAAYALARRVMEGEPAAWSALLLAVSPLFFAQSTLVFLDLPAALFTTLAVLALLERRLMMFALAASLAVMTKETTVVMLPVAWAWVWLSGSGARFGMRLLALYRTARGLAIYHAVRALALHKTAPRLVAALVDSQSARRRTSPSAAPQPERQPLPLRSWIAMTLPLIPLIAWTLYYHHVTGFWTGNAEYLQYNLHSTLDPARFFWTLLRRLYEVFIGGFNWLIILGAVAGFWWGKKKSHRGTESQRPVRRFVWLACGLIVVYVIMLSTVGGAVLPRYLLPIFPVFFASCVILIWKLPRAAARGFCGAAATCFVAAWFLNPAYPFAFENNLAYADFIRLHQDAARYLESRPPGERILTAWPATDELSRPFLGYVTKPLRVVPLRDFRSRDFDALLTGSFDIVYLYSRKWEPPNHWLARWGWFRRIQMRHFDYEPPAPDRIVAVQLNLKLLQEFHRRGQWVRIYSRQEAETRNDQ